MEVLFLPADLDGSGCYRCIFPMQQLALRGHKASMPPFVLKQGNNLIHPLPGRTGLASIPPGNFEVGFMADKVESCDVVVVQGGLSEHQLTQALRFRDQGSRLVLDLDDDVHRIPQYNPGRRMNEGFSRRNTMELVKLADVVTCATKALADFYGQWAKEVVVLRNRLYWPMWENIDRGAGWKRFRVGYMGNMDFHRADLETIAPQLRKWLVANPEVEFVAAGDPRIHEVVGTPESQRVCTSQVFFRNLDLPQIVASFDVGLVPLVRNDFNECKSWLKGLEYAACGIPCIATPTQEYQRFVREGETGWLAKWPKDFVACLTAAAGDPALVQRMGDQARERARDLSLDRWIHEWETAYGGPQPGESRAQSPSGDCGSHHPEPAREAIAA